MTYPGARQIIDVDSDPIGKFEETMPRCDQTTLNAFYCDNRTAVISLEPARGHWE